MRYSVRETASNGVGLQALEDTKTGDRAVVCPALGFTCFQWVVGGRDLLWADPAFPDAPFPTRSGIPILVPFPNRIRGGQYRWAGRDYQVPINDPQQKNAIHGFACSRPWRVVSAQGGEERAEVRAVFQGSVDAPECRGYWPADYRVEATYTLSAGELRFDVIVGNPDAVELPFGFGLHPYFRFSADASRFHVLEGAVERWPLIECLPTGERVALDGHHCMLIPGASALSSKGIHWDDAYRVRADAIRAEVADTTMRLVMETSPGFRDLVVFTPPHREAVCLEPYTCITDAINLQAKRVDAGLLVLPPRGQWHGWVRFTVQLLSASPSATA